MLKKMQEIKMHRIKPNSSSGGHFYNTHRLWKPLQRHQYKNDPTPICGILS